MFVLLAGTTRLELATFCVTGRRSNQLSYAPTKSAKPFFLFWKDWVDTCIALIPHEVTRIQGKIKIVKFFHILLYYHSKEPF